MNEEVVSHLREAVAALDAADIPSELREVAFGRAFDIIVGTARSEAGLPVLGTEGVATSAAVMPYSGARVPQRFVAIAKELDIDPELVERLFDEHGEDELQFTGSLAAFGTTKQAMVDGIAVLLCSARVAGGYDPDGRTSDAVIRAEVERHGLYDVTNYSKHTKQLRRIANVNGSGRSATYKLKYEGRLRARELARLALGSG